MLTEKDYCDYDTCVALRELGYNYPQRLIPDYFGVFNEPQYDEKIHLYDAQKWLREEKGIFSDIGLFNDGAFYYCIRQKNNNYWAEIYKSCFHDDLFDDYGKFESYEEALSEGIKEAINILKENETIHG